MTPPTLWRVEHVPGAHPAYRVLTAYVDPDLDVEVARVWEEPIARRIVRLHNDDALRSSPR